MRSLTPTAFFVTLNSINKTIYRQSLLTQYFLQELASCKSAIKYLEIVAKFVVSVIFNSHTFDVMAARLSISLFGQ